MLSSYAGNKKAFRAERGFDLGQTHALLLFYLEFIVSKIQGVLRTGHLIPGNNMPRRLTFSRLTLLILLMAAPLSGCAGISAQDSTDAGDPFESFNRQTYDSNYFLDRLIFRPLAELYRVTVPPGIRRRVADILSNMNEPVILTNNLLQGEFGKAAATFERFGINTTLGVGGMWDVAGDWGLRQQTGDFGQTLASWGIGAGPYLMLPLYGPSNVRDALGKGVDLLMSPWQYVAFFAGGTSPLIQFEAADFGTSALVLREKNIEKVDTLRAGSIDPYARLRSAYRQYRRNQLGEAPDAPGFEDQK